MKDTGGPARLWGIETGGGSIQLKSVPIKRETVGQIIVKTRQWFLKYKMVLSRKHDKYIIFRTPELALRAFIDMKERDIGTLCKKIDTANELKDQAEAIIAKKRRAEHED